jgi:hypothetical protein
MGILFVAITFVVGGCDESMPPAPDAGRDASVRPDGGPLPPDVCGPTSGPAVIASSAGEWRGDLILPGARAVHDLAHGLDGSVYVGGRFDHVSGAPHRNVARLTPDGRWEALGSGLERRVSALAVSPAGTVYAATGLDPRAWSMATPSERDFATARVHRFEGGAWTTLGTIEGGAIFGLAADGDERVYVVGDFAAIEGVSASHFAILEGTRWREGRALGAPAVAVFADSDGACFAGLIGGDEGTSTVECGQGGAFTPLPLPADFRRRPAPAGFGLFAVAPPIVAIARDAEGRVVIGGNFEHEGFAEGFGSLSRYTGAAWEPLGGGVGYDPARDRQDWGVVADLALDAGGALWIAGDFARAGVASSPLVHGLARLTGAGWEDVPSARLDVAGLSDSFRVGIGRFDHLAASPLGMMVSGGFSRIEGVATRQIALYTMGWQPVPSSATGTLGLDGEVLAIALRGGCGPYVGGAFQSDGTGRALRRVARWDGDGWQPVGDGVEGTVRALAIAPDGALVAVALPELTGSAFGEIVLRQRGNRFDEIGRVEGHGGARPGEGAGEILAMTVARDGRVYVGGSFASIGGVAANNVAVFDGERWQALGEGIAGWVHDLAVTPEGSVVAVGRFERADGAHVVVYDGERWSALGSLRTLPLSSVAVWRDQVVVSAYLDGRIGEGGSLVARFDGTAWHDLGSEDLMRVEGGPTRLVAAGDALVLVGQLPLYPEVSVTAKIAVWHGERWVPLDRSGADIGYAAALSSEGVWLGGSFAVAGAVPADQIAFFQFEAPE